MTIVDNFEIRILYRVEIRVDDMPLRLPAQEAKALSVLVAAHRPVHRDTMVSAIWGADETAREKDRLSPVISRLRYKLAKGRLGIAMSRESHSYWLTAEPLTLRGPTDNPIAHKFRTAALSSRPWRD